MRFQCPECRAILESDEVSEGMVVSCPECGATIECHEYSRRVLLHKAGDDGATADGSDGLPGSIHAKVASAIGIEKLKGFKLSDLFAEVFSRHSREEVEEYFTTGTERSTPDILEVDASWPKPWLFMRMAIASLVLFFLFWAGWKQFANPNLLPGLMMVGSFAIPISTLVLFIELNVRRNISLYMVARMAFLGGIISLLIALAFYHLLNCGLLPNSDFVSALGAMSGGPVEESAKVLAMVAVARAAKYKYKLNGLLVGAAVGTGFAAFESMGYALNCFVDGTVYTMLEAAGKGVVNNVEEAKAAGVLFGGADIMLDVIILRGVLSPLGHIVWSAIAGCALWRVVNGQAFKWRMLCDERFVRLLLAPVFLHMVWNAPFELPLYGKCLLAGAVGWFVCLSLVQEGLHEIAEEQAEAVRQVDLEAENLAGYGSTGGEE